MNKKSIVVVGAALITGAAWAQGVLGTATEVQGLVTVSTGSSMNTAVVGAPIMDGSQFMTSTGSFATLKLANGCELRMKPNQSITIGARQTCDELLALLETTSRQGLFAVHAGAAFSPAAGLAILGSAGYILDRAIGRRPSTVTPGGGGVIPGGGGGGIPEPISPQ
jgi:hypothetical protein